MVILVLAGMLMLSGVIAIGALQPVLSAFVLFMALYVAYMAGCMIPAYVRTRTVSAMAPSPVRVPPSTARTAIARSRLPAAR